MKKIYLVFISVIIISLGFVWWINARQKTAVIDSLGPIVDRQNQVEEVAQKKETVRLSIFNALEEKASLEIPVAWEGNYRIKENQNKASFMYIGDPAHPFEFMRINYYTAEEWSNSNEIDMKEKKIIASDKYIFTYYLSTDIPAEYFDGPGFKSMINDISKAIESFKLK